MEGMALDAASAKCTMGCTRLIDEIYRSAAPAGEKRRLALFAVRLASLGAGNVAATANRPQADLHLDAVEQALVTIQDLRGLERKPSVGDAKQWLRQVGAIGAKCAAKLGKLTKLRNSAAHPLVHELLHDLRHLEQAKASDAEEPEGEAKVQGSHEPAETVALADAKTQPDNLTIDSNPYKTQTAEADEALHAQVLQLQSQVADRDAQIAELQHRLALAEQKAVQANDLAETSLDKVKDECNAARKSLEKAKAIAAELAGDQALLAFKYTGNSGDPLVPRRWEVIEECGLNIRLVPEATAPIIASKKKGAVVKGWCDGRWLHLAGEQGFMLIENQTLLKCLDASYGDNDRLAILRLNMREIQDYVEGD